jgi:hypothetical protein
MFIVIKYLLILFIHVRAFVNNLPKRTGKSIKKISNGVLHLIKSVQTLSYRSYDTVSRNILRELGHITPSRVIRRLSVSHTMLAAMIEDPKDDWGFHVDHDDETHGSIVEAIKKRYRQAISDDSTHNIQVIESHTFGETVDLGNLWNWENEEYRYEQRMEILKDNHEDNHMLDAVTAHSQWQKVEWYHRKLQKSPSFLHSLHVILDKAHWGVKEKNNHYGAQVSILGDDLVIGFRGTATLRDLVTDLRIKPVMGPYGVHVHQGFLEALQDVNKNDELTELILRIVKNRGLKRIIVTGYSLGAAVAALYLLSAGERLRETGVDVRCITFGCPRFVDTRESAKLPHTLTSRIINTYVEGDPIPLNLTSMMGFTDYCHVGNSMLIKNNGEGIDLWEENSEGKVDSHIKWWGLRTPWSSHLTETYDRNLKMVEDKLLLSLNTKHGING